MTLAAALLAAALFFFLLSARPFKQPERFLIWLIGAALCAWSGWLVFAAPGHYGLIRAFADSWNGDAVANVFARNSGGVAQFVPQLLDFFIIASALLGLFSIVAFTPGEEMERVLRPAMLVMLGFMAGGFAALAVVAIGLGGHVRPRSYFGTAADADVHDGDTFRMGDVSLRLWGVDAPELGQTCRGIDYCGERARARLAVLLNGALVQCDQKESRRTRRQLESFGRPLVRCWARRGGEAPFDVGERMIQLGYAVQYRGETSYGYAAAEEIGRTRALMTSCFLRPDVWRTDAAARLQFEQGGEIEDRSLVRGACGPDAPPPATLAGAPFGGDQPLPDDDEEQQPTGP